MTCIWNNLLKKNISQFQTRFPELYKILESRFDTLSFLLNQQEENLDSPDSLSILNSIFSFWEFSTARDGSITAKEDSTYIHSGYNPVKEAQKLFACDEFNNSDFSWIFAGIGLGYAPVEFAKTSCSNLMIIIEPDPGFLFASMCVLDWTPVFSHEKCVIITDTQPDQVVPLLETLKAIEKTKIITNSSQTRHQQLWFKNFFTLLERNKQKQNINTNTLEKFSSLWLRNCASNLKYFPQCPGINIYKDCLDSKIPALICAAGPSLEAVLPFIKEIKNKAVIICVDTALRSLLRYGVQPDFILLIDPQYYAACHITGLRSPESVLITESSVYPSVMRFKARKTVLCESLFPLGRYFEHQLLPDYSFGKITAGGSVSTSAWDFAKFAGAKKIFMAGLDLGYPDNKTHIKGSTFEEKSHSSSLKIKTAENNLCGILFNAANEKSINFENGEIITDSKMKLFAWWFESQIAKYPEIETFTLSSKSLKIPGMKVSDINQLLSYPDCSNEKDLFFKNSESRNCSFSEEAFNAELENMKKMLSDLYSQARKGYNLCQKILKESPAKAENMAVSCRQELNQIDSYILNSQAKAVASLVFPTERQLDSIISSQKKYNSQTLNIINKTKIIYQELLKAIEQYQKYL